MYKIKTNLQVLKSLLKRFKEQDKSRNSDKEKVWESILIDIDKHTRLRRRKRVTFIWSVAAIILGAIFYISIFELKTLKESESDILSYVQDFDISKIKQLDQVQLILDNKQEVKIMSDKSNITYSRDGKVEVKSAKQIRTVNVTKVKYNTVIVPKGKRTSLTLSDGTKVDLNSSSILTYPVNFNGKKRLVHLEGEAYFDVAKNTKVPFVVKSRRFDIHVLGTKFNTSVYSEDKINSVVLIQGLVQLNSPESSETILLHPDEKVDVSKGISKPYKVDATKYLSWREGILTIENETLEDVRNQLNRYYRDSLKIANSLKQIRVNGKLDMKQPFKELIQVIANAVNVEVISNDSIFYFRKKIINYKK